MACDNLLAVELVTADGEQIRASQSENPDLFWALHGGGGNFGVATAFEFSLHPVGPIVMAGLMLWPGDRGRELLRAVRAAMDGAPDDLALAAVYLTGPPEEFVPARDAGQAVLRARRSCGQATSSRRASRTSPGSASSSRPWTWSARCPTSSSSR